ncbi:MAG: TadE family protein, partial [Verrucomicrobiota bacterium]
MKYLREYCCRQSTGNGAKNCRCIAGVVSMAFKSKGYKGQTIVEFALCLPLFLMLIFALIDFNRYSFQKQTMQRILRATARYA